MTKFLVVTNDGIYAFLTDKIGPIQQNLKEKGEVRIFEIISDGNDISVEEVDEHGVGHELPNMH